MGGLARDRTRLFVGSGSATGERVSRGVHDSGDDQKALREATYGAMYTSVRVTPRRAGPSPSRGNLEKPAMSAAAES